LIEQELLQRRDGGLARGDSGSSVQKLQSSPTPPPQYARQMSLPVHMFSPQTSLMSIGVHEQLAKEEMRMDVEELLSKVGMDIRIDGLQFGSKRSASAFRKDQSHTHDAKHRDGSPMRPRLGAIGGGRVRDLDGDGAESPLMVVKSMVGSSRNLVGDTMSSGSPPRRERSHTVHGTQLKDASEAAALTSSAHIHSLGGAWTPDAELMSSTGMGYDDDATEEPNEKESSLLLSHDGFGILANFAAAERERSERPVVGHRRRLSPLVHRSPAALGMPSDMTLHGSPQQQLRKKDQKPTGASVDSAIRTIYERVRPDLSTPIERMTPSPQALPRELAAGGEDAASSDGSQQHDYHHHHHHHRLHDGKDEDPSLKVDGIDERERQRRDYEKTIEGISLESKEAMGLIEAKRIVSKPKPRSSRFDAAVGPTIARPVIHIRRYVLRLSEEDEATQKKTALVQIVLGRGRPDDS
jgi:hypothetical protein